MELNTIVLPTGEQVDPSEWTTTPLYSTVEAQIGVAISTLQLFSYSIGQPVPITPSTLVGSQRTSTIADTNMRGDGILPEDERIILYSIQVELINAGIPAEAANDGSAEAPDMSLDMTLFCQRDTLAILHVGSRLKEYCRAPIGYFPGTVGVNRIAQPNAQVDGAHNALHGYKVAYNSGIDPQDGRDFASPHDIPGGTVFDLSLEFPIGGINPTAGAGNLVRFRSKFYGFRKRPVT